MQGSPLTSRTFKSKWGGEMIIKRLKSAPSPVRNSKAVNKNMLQKRKVSNRAGLTLIEIMVTISVIVIVVMGVAAYRYHSALNVRRADIQITAARLALFLLDNWKGQGGNSNYDPYQATLGPGLTIYNNAPGPAVPSGFTALDATPNYRIAANGVSYYTTLSYKD